MTARVLGPIGMKAIEGRGISAETAVRYGIHTGSQRDGEFVPSMDGNVVAFPFFENGNVVNEKYRAPGKKFWQRTGGKKTFWNADALDDPALEDGRLPLVITEGEIDALTAIECGFPLTVSVPDGAPPPATEKRQKIDDSTGKFEFVHNNRDKIARIKRFVLAVDNDAPGKQLAEELVRRFGAVRCLFVTYPERKKKPGLCKDLNEVLDEYGVERVVSVINGAQPYPVHGLYRLSDYPQDDNEVRTFSTGWQKLDKHFKPFIGELVVVTGIPSHGKSQWCLNLLSNLAVEHGWRSAIFSPEMPTVPHLRNKLYGILGNNSHLLEDRFVFIDAEPAAVFDESNKEIGTLPWVVDLAGQAVMRDGIRVLLIDPWNEVEQARKFDEAITDYVGRSLRALKRFARLYGVVVIVVCHPTKDIIGQGGKQRAPSLYDCEGSAHWFNKCDHGIIIERASLKDEKGREIDHVGKSAIHVAKSRFSEAGVRGTVNMEFNRQSGRYTMLDDDGLVL